MSVVLVTGSSTGIGLATALHFGRLGGGVYAGVRNIATASEQLTLLGECEQIWEPTTHMTKEEWSEACRRVDAESKLGAR